MHKFTAAALAALTTFAFAAPAAATIINLDSVNNASMDGSNAVSLLFDAGTYKVTFVQDEFTAFSRWTTSSGCDALGQNCKQGWENSAVFFLGSDLGTAHFLGDGGAHGGYGPLAEGGVSASPDSRSSRASRRPAARPAAPCLNPASTARPQP